MSVFEALSFAHYAIDFGVFYIFILKTMYTSYGESERDGLVLFLWTAN